MPAVHDPSLFDVLIRTTTNGVMVTDTDGLVLECNDACARLFQFEAAEVLGGPADLMLTTDSRPKLRDAFRALGPRAVDTNSRIECDVQGRRRDGGEFPMHLAVGQSRSAGRCVFVIVVRDETELHRERIAHDEEKAYLALITESSNDAIISYMLDGTVRSWNGAAEKMFGYSADEIVGFNAMSLMFQFVPADMIADEKAIFTRVLAGETVQPYETVRLHKDGTPVQIQISASPIRDAAGAVVGIARTVRDISERKKHEAERKTHEQERALLNLAIENSDDGYACLKLDGSNFTWSRGLTKMLGYGAEDINGRNASWIIPRIVPPELQATEFEYSQRAALGEKIGPYETVRIRKDGSKLKVLSTVYPVRGENGAVIAIARTLHDITDRLALEEQRALLGAVVESSTDAIISYGLDGTITSWNRGAELIYGYKAAEMIGQSLYGRLGDFMPPDQVAEERRIVARVIAGERVPPYEAVRTRKDGSEVHVLVSVSPIRDTAGATIGTSRVVRDITERKEFEKQRVLLSSIVESSNDAVFTKTLHGIVTSWNAAAEAMFGFPASEIIGRSMLVLVPADRLDEEKNALARIRAGETIRHFETRRKRRDGSVFDVSITLSPLRDGEGAIAGASSTIRDITERKSYETRLEAMREDMIHVARVHELSQVSAGIAHELNQPLTAMLNYSNVARRLVENAGDLAKLPGVAARIGEQAERAAQIIRRMRDFVEKRAPQRSVVDVNEIVEDAAALALIGSKTANIETRYVHAEGALPVLADRVQIQQVLVNLLRNGAEAMAEAARRELTVDVAPAENGKVRIAVTDTGHGISDEVAARLFTPFVTTKAEGMGIGLAISKSIIESHGGMLTARPNPGGGAIFEFTLPAYQAS